MVGGGSQMTMYEWAPEESEIRHVTSQNDLQFMKVRFRNLPARIVDSTEVTPAFPPIIVFRLVARPCI
jgi:hypothetical protein